MLARLRGLIRAADASVVEAWKWGTPVWSSQGHMICTGESFAKGTSLPDPAGLFNSSLDGKVRRAIDFRAGDPVDQPALAALASLTGPDPDESTLSRQGQRAAPAHV